MTRIDLNDDLAERLRSHAKTRGISLREYVSDLLEEALSRLTPDTDFKERFHQRTFDLGTHLENPWSVLMEIETEDSLKLHSRK